MYFMENMVGTISFDFSDFFSNFIHFFCWKEGKLHYRTVKCKEHEKRDRLLVSKVDCNFQISQRNETFTYRSSFLKWVIFIEKVSAIFCLRNS